MKAKWVLFSLILLLWVLGAAGLTWHSLNVPPPQGSTHVIEVTKLILLFLGGLGVILPSYFNIWHSIESNAIIRQRLAFDLANNTHDIIIRWDDASLLQARKLSRDIGKKRAALSDDELIKLIDGNSELEQSIISIFNYYEQVRVSVELGRVNEAVLKHSIGGMFLKIYERYLPWIKRQPSAYFEDMEILYKRWR